MADQQLISRYEAESKNISEQENVVTEKTGLYELEFIETHRHWFTETVTIETHDSVNMLNLIEGEKAVVESLDNSFEPFPINFGETFIVPNHVRRYKIRNTSSVHDRPVAVIQAFVRNL